MYSRILLSILTICFWLSSTLTVRARCAGIGLSGYGSYLALTSYSEIRNGKTGTRFLTLAYTLPWGTNCPHWRLTIRTSGSFTNGTHSIAPGHISIRFNSADGGPAPTAIPMPAASFPLSTSETDLLTQANTALQAPPDYYFTHMFDLTVQGGSHLHVPTGLYSTNLIITLYRENGEQVATASIPLCFSVEYAVTCFQTSLDSYLSGSGATFTTYEALQNGITAPQYINLSYTSSSSATCAGWKLRVTASGNFSNGSEEVALRHTAIRFNCAEGGPPPSSIPMPTSSIPLRTTETAVVVRSDAAIEVPTAYFFTHRFDLIIQGGNHLLLPDGTYTTMLIFTFYDSGNNLISSTNIPVCFQISYQGSGGGSSLSLAAGSDLVNFSYTGISEHQNGLTVSMPACLHLTSFSNYQVMARTIDANFSSPSNSYTFPASVITLRANLNSSAPTGCAKDISCHSFPLSVIPQTLISNANAAYPCQDLVFDLSYSTQANDSRLFFAPAGNYQTAMLLILVPY
ncbi:MAG: hypothetical protein AB7D05_01780 [Mangrovibacterium sp.]